MILKELRTDFYVYQHRRLDTNQIFYVGRGVGFRAKSKTDRNQYWHRIVNKTSYQIEYIVKNITKEFADLCEIESIDLYKRRFIKLANMTNGGDGNSSGISPSELTKKKLSDALKGKKKTEKHCKNISICRKGIKPSEASKKKMSDSHIKLRQKVIHPFLGKKHSEEAKKKMSIMKMGKQRKLSTTEKVIKYLNGTFFITNGFNFKRIKGDFVLPIGWRFGKAPYKLKGQ